MILYFSGTGNSRYAAQVLALRLADELVSINDLVKNNCRGSLASEKPFIFVCPTYAWRIPRLVERFIRAVEFVGSNEAYFILTCESETGGALRYINKLCNAKGLSLHGFAAVNMPQNYLALFDVADEAQCQSILNAAQPQLLALAEQIKNGGRLRSGRLKPIDHLKSSVINPVFYLRCVSARGFRATDACTGCGQCSSLCPLNNIAIADSKPHWGRSCTHCMACIGGCPAAAIEYKRRTVGKPRYFNNGYHAEP